MKLSTLKPIMPLLGRACFKFCRKECIPPADSRQGVSGALLSEEAQCPICSARGRVAMVAVASWDGRRPGNKVDAQQGEDLEI